MYFFPRMALFYSNDLKYLLFINDRARPLAGASSACQDYPSQVLLMNLTSGDRWQHQPKASSLDAAIHRSFGNFRMVLKG